MDCGGLVAFAYALGRLEAAPSDAWVAALLDASHAHLHAHAFSPLELERLLW